MAIPTVQQVDLHCPNCRRARAVTIADEVAGLLLFCPACFYHDNNPDNERDS